MERAALSSVRHDDLRLVRIDRDAPKADIS